MDHTFIRKLETFPPRSITILLTGVAAIASIVFLLLMRPVEAALKDASPYGVMELEFAWTVEQINQIFESWTMDLITQELTVTFLDFGFLISYSTFIAGITLFIVRKILSGQLQLIGLYMVLLPFIAALFDAMENFNLILMLSSPSNFPMFSPFLASFFATLKFGLLFVVIIFWIISIAWFLYQRLSSQSK